jgi:hypothetical protein
MEMRLLMLLKMFRGGGINYLPSTDKPLLDYGLIKVDAREEIVIWGFPETKFSEIVDTQENYS